MQIDWLTVAAQILNFLVLAWLLKRFLYRPVIDAMTQREQRIATRLAQAAQREAQAQAEARTYRDKVAAFDRDRQAQLAQAREAAEHERRSLLESARGEARASRQRWQQELEREQDDFRTALVRELAEAAIDVARRTLTELADATLEGQALATLARRIRALPQAQRQALADAAPRLQLASSFEPEAQALQSLRQVLADTLGKAVELECVRKPELVFGVELVGGGHKLAWSVAGALDDIAEQVRTSIAQAREATHEAPAGADRGAARRSADDAAPAPATDTARPAAP